MTTTTRTKYGLRNKKTQHLVTFESSSNGNAEFCGEMSTTIYPGDEKSPAWLVDSPEQAMFALQVGTPWYNSSYETPARGHNIDSNKFEVVRVEIVESVSPVTVVLPTLDEYFDYRIASHPKEAKLLEHYRQEAKRAGDNILAISWHDLTELLAWKQKQDNNT